MEKVFSWSPTETEFVIERCEHKMRGYWVSDAETMLRDGTHRLAHRAHFMRRLELQRGWLERGGGDIPKTVVAINSEIMDHMGVAALPADDCLAFVTDSSMDIEKRAFVSMLLGYRDAVVSGRLPTLWRVTDNDQGETEVTAFTAEEALAIAGQEVFSLQAVSAEGEDMNAADRGDLATVLQEIGADLRAEYPDMVDQPDSVVNYLTRKIGRALASDGLRLPPAQMPEARA